MDDKNLAMLLEMIASRDAQINRLSGEVELLKGENDNLKLRLSNASVQLQTLREEADKEAKTNG